MGNNHLMYIHGHMSFTMTCPRKASQTIQDELNWWYMEHAYNCNKNNEQFMSLFRMCMHTPLQGLLLYNAIYTFRVASFPGPPQLFNAARRNTGEPRGQGYPSGYGSG